MLSCETMPAAGSIQRALLLRTVWSWLPAFRAVAETQHLPSAAARLHVSMSALSRSIRLLEQACGRPLFSRSGRNLVLNTTGHALLTAVQSAMGSVDDALANLDADPFRGPVRVGTLGVLTNFYVLPALLALKEKHPALEPDVVQARPGEANEELARGVLDVAFYYDAIAREDLAIEPIGDCTASVYAGRRHPLYDARRVSLADVLAHEFSVPAIGERGAAMDGWPVDVPRKVGLRISLLLTNVEVCRSGKLLTVLPDVVALPHCRTREIRRLPLDLIPPTRLYAARRPNEAAKGRTETIVDAVRARVAEIDGEVAALRRAPPSAQTASRAASRKPHRIAVRTKAR
jgi:DNA-binding transcriptional LysR family regulator